MDTLSLTGMLLSEAREALAQKGITEYRVVVTAPPRETGKPASEDSRVLLVYWDRSPIELLVC